MLTRMRGLKCNIVAALIFIAMPASVAEAQEFCAALKEVVASTTTNFQPILGRKRSSRWGARTQLPGWEDCDIGELTTGDPKSRYYTCQLEPIATREAAIALLDRWGAAVRTCLGSDWTPVRSTRDGRPRLDFEAKDTDPVVNLRIRFRENEDIQWQVRIDVDLPER